MDFASAEGAERAVRVADGRVATGERIRVRIARVPGSRKIGEREK